MNRLVQRLTNRLGEQPAVPLVSTYILSWTTITLLYASQGNVFISLCAFTATAFQLLYFVMHPRRHRHDRERTRDRGGHA